jgi:hypothetical protein
VYSSYMKVLIDAAVHSELGKVIKCAFKSGSVERSIDLPKRVYNFNFRQWLFSSGYKNL